MSGIVCNSLHKVLWPDTSNSADFSEGNCTNSSQMIVFPWATPCT